MLKKFQNSKAARITGCLILAVVIFYSMSDGFYGLVGETSGTAGTFLGKGGYSWQETAAAVVLVLWAAVAVIRKIREQKKGQPKNDVNVRY